MSQGNLMPIGRFARSCRLSVKALRHYDELGLLSPAFVDPQSRYRYYGREQARDAVMIGMLRSLDLPLEVIRTLLRADAAEVARVVERETARIEAEVARKQAALLSLERLASGGGLAPYEVTVEERPARPVARLYGSTTTGTLIPDTTDLVDRLFSQVARAALKTRGSVFVLNRFHEDRDRIDLEACIALEEGPAPEAPESEALELGTHERVTLARLVHVGPYETLGLAHHALIAWLQERGHEAGTTVWEFYRNDPKTVPGEQIETVVAMELDGVEAIEPAPRAGAQRGSSR